MFQPPSLRSYNFKERGDVCIAATIGSNYEFQAAYSPMKHVYLKSGFRHAKRNDFGIISNNHKYNSHQLGAGYYKTFKSNSYIQFGTEFFDGAGKIENQVGNSTPEYTYSTFYTKGFAISGLYSYYSELHKAGFIFGIRKGKTWNAETLIDDHFTLNKYKIGILEHKIFTYSEYCFSTFRRYKDFSILAFNIDIGLHDLKTDLKKGTGTIRFSLSYQIPFNIRKKHKVN